jgi:PilZ domain
MTEERRTDARISLNLPARYDGFSGAYEARIEDISVGGCFVYTPGQVSLGEIITVEIKMLSGEWLQLRGEVTAHQPGIGFGMLFSFLTEDEEQSLRELLNA